MIIFPRTHKFPTVAVEWVREFFKGIAFSRMYLVVGPTPRNIWEVQMSIGVLLNKKKKTRNTKLGRSEEGRWILMELKRQVEGVNMINTHCMHVWNSQTINKILKRCSSPEKLEL